MNTKIYFAGISVITLMAVWSANAAIRVTNAHNSRTGGGMVTAPQTQPVGTITYTTDTTGTANNTATATQSSDNGATSTDEDAAHLAECARIYPNGEFEWGHPTIGGNPSDEKKCIAVVEMRGYQMGPAGADLVVARVKVAAGNAIRCNISDFPESSYLPAAGTITFPADDEPSVDDVIRVLNEEQRKNAGFKIAASTIIGGVGGNMVGGNEIGQSGVFGTGKKKMQSTVIGALGGGAIGAGGAYAGKIGGDMIMSIGINAGAGGIMANVLGAGDSVLRVEDCTINNKKTKCIWGTVITGTETDYDTTDGKKAYYNIDTNSTIICDKDNKNCKTADLINIKLDAYPDKDLEEAQQEKFDAVRYGTAEKFTYTAPDVSTGVTTGTVTPGFNGSPNGIYAKIKSAVTPDQRIMAMVEFNDEKAFGSKMSDWYKWRTTTGKNATVYGRDSKGAAYSTSVPYSVGQFYPSMISGSDGEIIDFSNKARLKSTVTGVGIGGALGAFSGYQGAQQDIQDRWVAAVREYKDSLQKVYCATGRRYLSQYNDITAIPEPM